MYVCVERKYLFFAESGEINKNFEEISKNCLLMSNFSPRSSKIIILTDKHRFKNNFSISINAPCICRGGSELCILLGTSLVSLATWLLNTATQTISRLADNRDSKVSWIYWPSSSSYRSLIDGRLKRTIEVPTDLPNYPNNRIMRSEAEFKKFEPPLKFETRLKYGWFNLNLYSMF